MAERISLLLGGLVLFAFFMAYLLRWVASKWEKLNEDDRGSVLPDGYFGQQHTRLTIPLGVALRYGSERTPAWLPLGLTFLSGLPESERRRRLLVPIQAWLDDSGAKGQGRIFTLGGWIAEAEAWASFSEEWSARLGEAPAIGCFKMREAARRDGDFSRLTAAERDAKVATLADVVTKYAKVQFYCSLDLDAYEETYGRFSRPFRDPYFLAWHRTILAIAMEINERWPGVGSEMFFDEHVIFGPRAKAWWPVWRFFAQRMNQRRGAILPVEPFFRSDGEFLPLQAADMAAWWMRRNVESRIDGRLDSGRDFSWLTEKFGAVPLSRYSQAMTGDSMVEAMKESSGELAALDAIGSDAVLAQMRELIESGELERIADEEGT